jgi:hypothetical protein
VGTFSPGTYSLETFSPRTIVHTPFNGIACWKLKALSLNEARDYPQWMRCCIGVNKRFTPGDEHHPHLLKHSRLETSITHIYSNIHAWRRASPTSAQTF